METHRKHSSFICVLSPHRRSFPDRQNIRASSLLVQSPAAGAGSLEQKQPGCALHSPICVYIFAFHRVFKIFFQPSLALLFVLQDTDLPPAFTSPMDDKDTHREPVIQNDGAVTKEQCPAVKNSVEPALQDIVLISDADQETVKGNSNGCHTPDRLRDSRPAFQWCHHLAWGLCLLLCLSCLVFAAVLGTRWWMR